MKARINIATTDRVNYPDLYSENESMVISLEKYGFEATLISWHDLYDQLQNNKYSGIPILVRTVWDYPDCLYKFLRFVNLLIKYRVLVINPSDVIKWNIQKTYLFDLQKNGIPIIPCRLILAGNRVEEVNRSVVKPVIGLGASGARILEPGESMTVEEDSLINPFLESIFDGEISVVMISGKPVLYIKKIPCASDWRVQPQYGGEYTFVENVPDDVKTVSEMVFMYVRDRFSSDELLFMRVDLLKDDDGKWKVLEFEAIDPSMYGSISPIAVDALSFSLSLLYKNKPWI